MVEPIPTLNGQTDAPGVIQSIQVLTLNKPSGDIIVRQNKNTTVNGFKQPTQEQITKGSYYDDMNKERKEKEQEIYSLINDFRFSNKKTLTLSPHRMSMSKLLRLADTTIPGYHENGKIYINAANELTKMLAGELPISLKRAVFVTENAYFHNTLNYGRYCRQIDSLVIICKAIMKHFGESPDNKLCCNYAIQALYQDTLKVGEKTFYPFIYDFDDIFGDKDYSKLMVTKLLNTGMGQCHSMPLLYLILAEELHTYAYLAHSPSHSYIKFPFDSSLYDFETTCGKPNTDEWLARWGYVSPQAVKTGIYLTPMTTQQTIAQCLADLTTEYVIEYGNDSFVEQCSETAEYYYPACLTAYENFAVSRMALCASLAAKYHNPPMEDYSKYPDLREEFDNMIQFQMKVDQTGFMQLPEEEYSKMISIANSEKERRKENEIKKSIYLHIQSRKQ